MKSDPLFELIKSLNKTEKRYFKTFTSQMQGDKKYLRLFDAIEKQSRTPPEEYNEKKIKGTFPKEKFVREFSNAKKYLYHLILKALQNYYANSSLDFKLDGLIQKAKILQQKGLYENCKNMLSKTEQLATKHEKFTQVFLIKNIESSIDTARGERSLEAEQHKYDVLKKLMNLQEYILLFKRIFSLSGYQTLRDEKTLLEYNSIMSNVLLSDENMALSHSAKEMFHSVHGIYNILNGNPEKALPHYKIVAELTELHPEQTMEWTNSYISILNNLGNICMRINDFTELQKTIDKMRSIDHRNSDHIAAKVLARSCQLKAFLYRKSGQSQKIISEVLPEVESGKKQFGDKISTQYILTFYFLFAYAFFEKGSYRVSSKWLHKLLTHPNTAHQTDDLICFAKLFSIIVHYELKNEELIRYSIVSTYRFLKKRKRLYKLEDTFLRYIQKKIFRAITKEEQLDVFKKMKKELSLIFKDPFERGAMEYFPFLSWLESKIQNRPFAEVMREKARRV